MFLSLYSQQLSSSSFGFLLLGVWALSPLFITQCAWRLERLVFRSSKNGPENHLLQELVSQFSGTCRHTYLGELVL